MTECTSTRAPGSSWPTMSTCPPMRPTLSLRTLSMSMILGPSTSHFSWAIACLLLRFAILPSRYIACCRKSRYIACLSDRKPPRFETRDASALDLDAASTFSVELDEEHGASDDGLVASRRSRGWPAPRAAPCVTTTTSGCCRRAGSASNGYRYYDADALVRLQRILLLRELGLGLPAIAEVLDGPARRRATPCVTHLRWLQQEQERLARQIAQRRDHDQRRRKEVNNSWQKKMFDGFDHTQYKEEVEERWGTEAYAPSDRWWTKLTEPRRRTSCGSRSRSRPTGCRGIAAGEPADGDEAQAIAQRQYDWLRSIPGLRQGREVAGDGDCVGLGEMYVADPRFAANYGGAEGASSCATRWRSTPTACSSRSSRGQARRLRRIEAPTAPARRIAARSQVRRAARSADIRRRSAIDVPRRVTSLERSSARWASRRAEHAVAQRSCGASVERSLLRGRAPCRCRRPHGSGTTQQRQRDVHHRPDEQGEGERADADVAAEQPADRRAR